MLLQPLPDRYRVSDIKVPESHDMGKVNTRYEPYQAGYASRAVDPALDCMHVRHEAHGMFEP